MKKIILASGSPRRKQLLEEAGFVFDVVESGYEEDMTVDLSPRDLAIFLSKGKAHEVAGRVGNDAVVVAADTFVVLDDAVLGKPTSLAHAKEMLRRLSGREHSIMTGITVIDGATGRTLSRAVESTVVFKNISDDDIDRYIATGEPLDKAGAYAVQGIGKILIERVEGDMEAIIGLPIRDLKEMLEELGS